jgi:transposase
MPSIVFQHHTNGTDYAYMSTSYWDKEKKASRTKMICIGKKDPKTGKVIYNRRWKELQQNEKQKKLIVAESPQISSTVSIGPSLLLGQVTKELGLQRSLLKGFDPETTKKLISFAWYLASSPSGRAYMAEGWMESHRCPTHHHPLTSPRISELMHSISRDQILSFFKSWIRRSTDREHLCFDITSVSSYGVHNPSVEYGYNRDGEKLPQINIALLSGMDSEIPFYYEILPGSLHDVSSLPSFIEMLAKLGMEKINLMMDKGFHSKKNLELLADQGIRFTMPVPKSSSRIKKYIDHDRDLLELPEHIVYDDERTTVYGVTHRTKLNGKRIYYHIYMDTAARIDHVRKFNTYILKLSRELKANDLREEHADAYAEFFTVKETPKRGRKVIWNQEAIRCHRDNFTGYWALVTNTESDAGRALTQYRKRDHVEKQFDTLKNLLAGNRLRTKDAVSAEAVVFLRFLSLIITERIRKTLRETPINLKDENIKYWISRYTVPEVFNRLESYTEVKFKQKYKPIHPAKTKAQREIFKIFDLE